MAALPQDWLQQLELRREIEALADDLVAAPSAGRGRRFGPERYPGY